MSKKFTPIFDRVVIRRVDSSLEKKTSGMGIILPDQVKDSYKASQGILLQCGDTCQDEIKALVGHEVLFNRFSGDEMKINGEEVVLMSEADILGGLNDE